MGSAPQEVIQNVPAFRESHLLRNKGETMYVIHSSLANLTQGSLPLPEVILYRFKESKAIDTLDLRQIVRQIVHGSRYREHIKVISDQGDPILQLSIRKFGQKKRKDVLMNIRLKDGKTWYKNIHILFHQVPMGFIFLSQKI